MVWLLMGYIFLIMYRPFEVWPALGVLRFELLYMLVTGVVWLAAPNKRVSFNGLIVAVGIMIVAVIFSILASPWADQCLEAMDPWLKLQVFLLMLITVVQDERTMKRLLATWLVVIGLYMLHSLWEFYCGRHVSRMGINRMVGVDTTNGDPNAFSTTLLLSLVFVPAFWRSDASPRIRCLLAGYVFLAMVCIAFTGSRTGFVTLGLFFLVIAWSSPWRKMAMIALVVLAPVGFLALPHELQNRFETLVNPEAGPKNAQTSAQGRWEGLEIGIRLWQDNLATGVGPGAWRSATGRKLQAHNLYGQLAGEMGAVGILAFTGLLAAFGFSLYRIRRAYRDHPEWGHDFSYHVSGGIALGVFLLLFTGIAGHNLFRPQWILYAAFLSIIRNRIAERIQEPSLVWDEGAEISEWTGREEVLPAMD
jgi:O-antigen ligase